LFISSILENQQKLLDPLQVILADGCHLTRQTDQLLYNSIHQHTNATPLFSKILSFDYHNFSSQWPISRQIFVSLEK
jgi:hypothetical protein